jgi:hypothetical protein
MRPFDDPSFLTPDERLSEVASILAAAVLRLHARAALFGDDPGRGIPPDSGSGGLEVSDETVLSVQRG